MIKKAMIEGARTHKEEIRATQIRNHRVLIYEYFRYTRYNTQSKNIQFYYTYTFYLSITTPVYYDP